MLQKTPFPYEDNQILTWLRSGELRGRKVRVNKWYSFFEATPCVHGVTGQTLHPAGWQIVLDIEVDGEWLNLVRLHENEVVMYCKLEDGGAK